jgi:FkbM family methyltransferase
VKRTLKGLRVSQPFNSIATSLVRATLRAIRVESSAVIRHLHRIGTVQSGLPNGRTLRLWSHADDWISNQVFWRGWAGYEPHTTPLFYEFAKRSSFTLDVGAYIGFYSILAAHANPASRVLAFEPLPTAFARLRRNIALNGLSNVACFESAIADRDGNADFFHSPTGPEAPAGLTVGIPCSSSLSWDFMKDVPNLQRSKVAITRLETLLHQCQAPRVELMKIDTESTEPAVLAGMGERLACDRPIIVCEVLKGGRTERRLEEILAPLDYRFYLLTAEGPQQRDRIDGHAEDLNYLFTTLEPGELAEMHSAATRAGY